jgi:nicotinate phosphoribosyltransferase
MAEIEEDGETRYTYKTSSEKSTLPGAKQVFRHAGHDEVTAVWEERPRAEPLLVPVVRDGSQLDALPDASTARDYCRQQLERVRPGRSIEYSEELRALKR